MKLTLELTDVRQETPEYGGRPKPAEYTRAKVDAEAVDPHVIAGHLRSIAEAIEQRPNPGAPF